MNDDRSLMERNRFIDSRLWAQAKGGCRDVLRQLAVFVHTGHALRRSSLNFMVSLGLRFLTFGARATSDAAKSFTDSQSLADPT